MGSNPSVDGLCSLSTILEQSLLKQLISLDAGLELACGTSVCSIYLVGGCPQQAKQSFQKGISKKLLELGS